MKKIGYIKRICLVLIVSLFSFQNVFGVDIVKNENKDFRTVKKDKVWNIKFNSIIDIASLNENSIYVLDMNGDKVSTIDLGIAGQDVISVSNTESYKEGDIYSLVVEDDIVDVNGRKLEQGRKLYFEISQSEITGFGIKEAKILSGDKIAIEFNEEIDSKAEIAIFYKLKKESGKVLEGSYKNFEVKRVDSNNNMVILTVKDKEFKFDENLFVQILGELESANGRIFNNGVADWRLIKVTDRYEKFAGVSARDITSNTFEITFNRNIDELYASNKLNFKLYNPKNKSLSITDAMIHDGNKVRLKLQNKISDVGDFRIVVKKMRDFTEEEYITNESITFEVDSIKQNILKYEATVLNRKTIEIKFEEKMKKEDMQKKLNFILQEKDSSNYSYIPNAIYFDEISGDRVKLFYGIDLDNEEGYKFSISKYLRNIYGDVYDFDSIRYIDGSNVDYQFEIDSVDVEENKVIIEFSSEIIAEYNTLDKANYSLIFDEGNGRKIIIECNGVQQKDGKRLLLEFNGMRKGEAYKLMLPAIKGYFGDDVDLEEGIDVICE